MSEGWPILSLVTFLPLVGAGFIFLIKGDAETVAKNARAAALWTSLITFLLSLLLWTDFDPKSAEFQFVEIADWIPALGSSTRWASTASRFSSSSCQRS